MNTEQQINHYINSQPEAKKADMQALHSFIIELLPESKLWFLEGEEKGGKVVFNTNVGYGSYTIHYTNGTSKEFYRVGFSGNTTGISVYIMGIKNKAYLPDTYGKTIGKASVTGYCIKFKKLSDIHLDVLKEAILYAASQDN